MSAKSESIVKSLLESIQSPSKETQPYDTSATVTRVEDDTVFVHIPGGVAETPCSKTISCKVGDTVQVRVGGGKAWLVGNASAPPTDDTTANTAIRKTNQLGDSLTKLQKIAGSTDQYFWHVETGEDTGSHITEIPKERFLEAPVLGGGNLLLRSNGIAIRDGLNELATFSGSAIQFNQPGTSTVVATIGTSGLYIQKGVIKLGNKTSASDTTNSGTYIDANGDMATSNILATGGTIGGWTINATSLARTFTITNGTQTTSLTNAGINFVRTVSGTQYISSYSADSFTVYGTDGTRVAGSPSLISLMSSSGNCAIYSTLINMDVNNVGSLYLTGNTIRTTYNAALAEITPSQIKVKSNSNTTTITASGINVTNSSGGAVHVICGSYNVALHANTAGNRGIYDATGSAWLIYKNTSNGVVIPSPTFSCGNTFNTDGQLHLGDEYKDAVHLSAVWSDASYHDIITRNASEAITYFGYPSATTVLRGNGDIKLKSTSGSSVTSDRNIKYDIVIPDERYEQFYDSLKPIMYKFINGQSGRSHAGYIAQEVCEALTASGLTTKDFGGYVRNDIENREPDDDKSDVNYLLDHNINEIHQLIYSEFISLNTWQIQKLKARVAELEARLNG